jgi:hypothetical protein
MVCDVWLCLIDGFHLAHQAFNLRSLKKRTFIMEHYASCAAASLFAAVEPRYLGNAITELKKFLIPRLMLHNVP